MKTISVICAWHASRVVDGQTLPQLARDLGAYLLNGGWSALGFTLGPSFGGGAGWPVEPGFTVTFAGLPSEVNLRGVAEWLRDRERQQAVCYVERAETFLLVERPAVAA
jgi:hypothetical protein